MSNTNVVRVSEPHVVRTDDYGEIVYTPLIEKSSSPSSKKSCSRLLGELLVEAGLVAEQQIQLALEEQERSSHLLFGEILVLHGWILQETADFFARKHWLYLSDPLSKPIGYYFQQAFLLNEQQIEQIKS